MSRCFPFPPPGYETKHRPEDLDILKEAKRKEKKHKKEKKDKERKKDKDKKKDENDEKQRDKKDRKGKHKDKKEKHKDKKKDKEDRSKDKDKSSISEESTVSGKLEKSLEKLHPKGYSKDRNSFVDEGKHSASFQVQNGEKASQSSLPPQRTEESKLVQELDRRIRDDKGRGSQLPERVAVVDKRDQEMATRTSGVLADEKGNNGKLGLKRLENEYSGSAIVKNLTPIAKSKYEGILRPVDGQNDKTMGGKEKHKETGDSKLGDKRRDGDKKSHGKEKDKAKEKKKEEKAKMKIENKKNKQEKLKEGERNDLVAVTSNKTYKSIDLLKDATGNAEVNFRKRKDIDTDTNGFSHEIETRPNKMQRPAHHEQIENGRKFQAFQTPSNSFYENHAVPKSALLDNNDRLINGAIKSQNPSPSKPNLSSVANMVRDQVAEVPKIFHRESISLNKKPILPKIEDQIAEPSMRLAHPDSKYLKEVLTVPVPGDWPENNDQEWLFSKGCSSGKTKSVGVEEEQCVWSEAVYIESVDVCALPYVIPY
ncbi:hypothetical protein ACJIZ3_009747 [Penstemon smallii]|uniref:Myb-like protein X n=1 Tax=Penstemon smallii TaxID=265156 RepID=A0ABD3TDE4_9LAMI